MLFFRDIGRIYVKKTFLSGVAKKILEALVDAGSLEVVALSVASGLRAEVLLRQYAVEYCQ